MPNDFGHIPISIGHALRTRYRKMEEPSMNIGERLRTLRTSKNLSQGDIERRSGLLRSYIPSAEHGHTVPSLKTLERWAKALEVEVYQLFFEGEGKPIVQEF